MTDVWTGDILLADNTSIQNVVLASQSVASRPFPPDPRLRFLATVDTARIPLYLAAGPSLDVWTTCEETEDWFQSFLLSKPAGPAQSIDNSTRPEWWACARAQSPVGILVQIEAGTVSTENPRVTELLFYGTVASPGASSLPTPPSSSPDVAPIHPGNLPELRVHALPLSSDLLHRSSVPEIPPLSPPLDAIQPSEPEFGFLPSQTSASVLAAPGSPKRKRDVFEEATQLRKKARRKGGEGIAAAAAKAGNLEAGITHRRSLSIDTKSRPTTDSRPASASGLPPQPPSRSLSRSPSMVSEGRPLSRKGYLDGNTRRSTLSQVATVSLQPEEPTIETRNKEALSKVVMAAMRMQGLQQRKKNRSRRGSVAPDGESTDQLSEGAAAEEASKDEEFKLIYHQTYKGAALAFRKHIATKPLHLQPDRLRDAVEKLLAIFCTDPLTVPLPSEVSERGATTPGQKPLGVPGSTHSHASPFDLPSGNRALASYFPRMAIHTGSPVSRKKLTDNTAPTEVKDQ